jgi:hypothetical protein
MTARQVMNEIKTMTPEERAQVAEFLRQLESGPRIHQVDDLLVEEVSDRILDRHAELMRKLAL